MTTNSTFDFSNLEFLVTPRGDYDVYVNGELISGGWVSKELALEYLWELHSSAQCIKEGWKI